MANVAGIHSERLQSFIDRIERLVEEVKAIQADIKEVKAEAKSSGFDVKTINKILKLRQMTKEERDEEEALLDLYMAALGMLGDTPLGAAAIERLTKKPEPQPTSEATKPAEPSPDSGDEDDAEAPADIEAAAPADPEFPKGPTAEDIDTARRLGAGDAQAGKPVTANPFPAGDPRRAAYDESWCMAAGSDGMDIPAAFRRTPKPKKPEGEQPQGEQPEGGAK